MSAADAGGCPRSRKGCGKGVRVSPSRGFRGCSDSFPVCWGVLLLSGKRTASGGEPGRASLDGVMLFCGVTPHHPWPLDAASPLLWDGQLFKAKA